MRRHARVAAAVVLTVFSLGWQESAAQQERAAVPVAPGQPIPRDFHTWSLFLVCNPTWLGEDTAAKQRMVELHSAFVGFGRSLGSRNAAVWFSGPSGRPGDYDADRASDFCSTYSLSGPRSPYVVITSTYPTEAGTPGDFAAISLAGLSTANILTLLGELSDRVRASELDRAEIDSDRYWRGWVQVLQDSLRVAGHLARGFNFSVDARFVKVSWDAKKALGE